MKGWRLLILWPYRRIVWLRWTAQITNYEVMRRMIKERKLRQKIAISWPCDVRKDILPTRVDYLREGIIRYSNHT